MTIETLAVHAGRHVDPETGAVTPAALGLGHVDDLIEDLAQVAE
jgi:O-acetylhomoserine/O-acetylserine sulfhydrylase-like pyridoxal-dependent enzyme